MGNPIGLVDAFAARTGDGVFPNISRQEVVDGLRARVNNPVTQNQNQSSLCGSAVLLFALLNDAPEVYVQYVIDLWTNGVGALGSVIVKPSKGCRNYKPPADKIAPVDWIALASLRDSENTAWDYSSADDEASGITRPSVLTSWFTALNFRNLRNETNLFLTKGESDIDAANKLYSEGNWVCLLINANMLESPNTKSASLFPNHWVVLRSKIRFGEGTPTRVYSWGKLMTIPDVGTMTASDFCKNFYGYVAARPVVDPPKASAPGDFPAATAGAGSAA
jgi:hypothetical protein